MRQTSDSTVSPVCSLRLPLRVRYVECDPMNVAHHSVYPVWLEIARTELLRRQGLSYRQLEASGLYIVVVELEIRYRRPAFYDDLICVEVELLPVQGVKIQHRYRIWREDQLLAEARTVLACVDRQGKPQPVPAMLRQPPASSTPFSARPANPADSLVL